MVNAISMAARKSFGRFRRHLDFGKTRLSLNSTILRDLQKAVDG
jgi:hypothetical protein